MEPNSMRSVVVAARRPVKFEGDLFDLYASMRYGQVVTLDHCSGIVNEIQREDGSGKRFNIELHTGSRFFYDTVKRTVIQVG